MSDINYKSDSFLFVDNYFEPKRTSSGDLIKYQDPSQGDWISAAVNMEVSLPKKNSLRSEWRGKYTKYLSEISECSAGENIDYTFFVKIVHLMVEDFDINKEFEISKESGVHKKSLINFLRHAPDFYEYLAEDSIFVDSDTKCVAVQIKRNKITMNMHFKKDGGIIFNTFDDDRTDNSFRIFGDMLTSGRGYLKAAKIKRILSILGS